MKSTHQSRIINVSSVGHTMYDFKIDIEDFHRDKLDYANYDGNYDYCYVKLLNVMFTKGLDELRKRQDLEKSLKVASLHPGLVRTELSRDIGGWKKAMIYTFWPVLYCCSVDAEGGSQTNLFTSLSPFEELQSGAYYSNCNVTKYCAQADEIEKVNAIWNKSKELLEKQMKQELDLPK